MSDDTSKKNGIIGVLKHWEPTITAIAGIFIIVEGVVSAVIWLLVKGKAGLVTNILLDSCICLLWLGLL